MKSLPKFSAHVHAVRKNVVPAIMAGVLLIATPAFAQPDYTPMVDGAIMDGVYHNITISPGISASISGVVEVTGTFLVDSAGAVAVSDAAYITGNIFKMNADASLSVENAIGIDGTTSGPIRTTTKDLGTKSRITLNSVVSGQITGINFPDELSELVINNSSGAGVTMTKDIKVRERLHLRNGELRTNGKKLILLSRTPDVAQVTAASCVVFQGLGTVTGDVTAQRYINPRFNPGIGYRHYSSSVSGPSATVANFSTPPNFDAIVNPQYNTVPYNQRFIAGNVLPYPNTFYYDEALVGSGGPGSYDYVFNQGYQSPASLADPLVTTRGYTVRIPASATVSFTGSLNSGDITTPPLTRGALNESGWHLVGNPYASKIDFTLLSRTNVMNSFYENRSNGATTGVYDSYVNGISTSGDGSTASGVNNWIAANQAFFVRVTAPGSVGSMTFTNAARQTEFRNDFTAPFFRPATANPLVRLRMQNANNLATETVVHFAPGATTGIDSDYDAFYINGGHPVGLYSSVGVEDLSINGLPALTTSTDYTVALVANGWAAGSYTINAAEMLNMPAGFQVLLQDAVTGTTQDLTQNPSYTFTSSGQNANSNRFTVRFRTAGVTGINSEIASASSFDVYPNPLKPVDRLTISLPGVEQGKNVVASIFNQVGQRVWSASYRAVLGGVREEIKTDLARGVYTLQVALPDGTKQNRRVVVQ